MSKWTMKFSIKLFSDLVLVIVKVTSDVAGEWCFVMMCLAFVMGIP